MAKGGIEFTEKGLAELSRIIKLARGNLTFEDFGKKVGLSHVTIWRVEMQKAEYIRISSLSVLAPHLGYSLEQLIAIAKGELPDEIDMSHILLTADSVLPIIDKLPFLEKRKLREISLSNMSDADLFETHQAVVEELHKRFKNARS